MMEPPTVYEVNVSVELRNKLQQLSDSLEEENRLQCADGGYVIDGVVEQLDDKLPTENARDSPEKTYIDVAEGAVEHVVATADQVAKENEAADTDVILSAFEVAEEKEWTEEQKQAFRDSVINTM